MPARLPAADPDRDDRRVPDVRRAGFSVHQEEVCRQLEEVHRARPPVPGRPQARAPEAVPVAWPELQRHRASELQSLRAPETRATQGLLVWMQILRSATAPSLVRWLARVPVARQAQLQEPPPALRRKRAPRPLQAHPRAQEPLRCDSSPAKVRT